MSWIDIGHHRRHPAARGTQDQNQGRLAVSRCSAQQTDEVFAASDRCPHKGGPLSDHGIVHGQSITCPLHNWVFDLNTGQAQGADDGRIATYPVRIADASAS